MDDGSKPFLQRVRTYTCGPVGAHSGRTAHPGGSRKRCPY